MKKIVIGFSRSKSPWKIGSQFIRAVEKRDFSHAYIRYTCPITNVEIVAQASKGFVNQMSFNIFKEHNIITEEYELDCTEQEFVDILTFTNNNLGQKYSFSQIVLIGIKKLFKFELPINNKDDEFICSEYTARVCDIKGVRVPTYLDYFTPSDFNTLVKDINLKRIA
jgi:hypothetical protein